MKKFKKIMVVVLLLALCITTVTGSGTTYELEEVYYPIYANGYEVPRGDLPILNYNGNTYVPLRKLSEAAWVDVNWDDATRSISVDNGFASYYNYKYVIAEYLAQLLKYQAQELLDCCSEVLIVSTDYGPLLSKAKKLVQDNAELNTMKFNKLFPNGLDINYEYDNNLNNYMYNVNEWVLKANLAAEYVQGYLDGVYTRDFAYNKYYEIRSNLLENNNPYTYSQDLKIIYDISDLGY